MLIDRGNKTEKCKKINFISFVRKAVRYSLHV